jgi:hypothetical protein
MESLSAEQQAEIDALILAGDIIPGMSLIKKLCAVDLAASRDLFKARYQQLRDKRSAEFACSDEQYWSCYGEDILDAIAKDW